MKKLLSGLLAVCLVLTLLPLGMVTARASGEELLFATDGPPDGDDVIVTEPMAHSAYPITAFYYGTESNKGTPLNVTSVETSDHTVAVYMYEEDIQRNVLAFYQAGKVTLTVRAQEGIFKTTLTVISKYNRVNPINMGKTFRIVPKIIPVNCQIFPFSSLLVNKNKI